MLLDIKKVNVLSEYILLLEFENGEIRRFNMSSFMNQPPWKRIKDRQLFRSAMIVNGTVAWPGNIDIDPETLYEYSEPEFEAQKVT